MVDAVVAAVVAAVVSAVMAAEVLRLFGFKTAVNVDKTHLKTAAFRDLMRESAAKKVIVLKPHNLTR